MTDTTPHAAQDQRLSRLGYTMRDFSTPRQLWHIYAETGPTVVTVEMVDTLTDSDLTSVLPPPTPATTKRVRAEQRDALRAALEGLVRHD